MPIVSSVPTLIFLIGRHGVKPLNALYHCMRKGLQLAPFLLINCVWLSYRTQAQTWLLMVLAEHQAWGRSHQGNRLALGNRLDHKRCLALL